MTITHGDIEVKNELRELVKKHGRVYTDGIVEVNMNSFDPPPLIATGHADDEFRRGWEACREAAANLALQMVVHPAPNDKPSASHLGFNLGCVECSDRIKKLECPQ